MNLRSYSSHLKIYYSGGTRKSNHRAVNISHRLGDESNESLDYFLPLLKEKKQAIRINALGNIINIISFQYNRIKNDEIDLDMINSICSIFSTTTSAQEADYAAQAICLLSIVAGSDHEVYKTVKGNLVPLITDGENHRSIDVLCSSIDALATCCFVCCQDQDSYRHTIDIFQEVLLEQKNKLVLNRALNSWLLLLTKVETTQFPQYQSVLERIVELSKSSYPELRMTSAVGLAFILDEIKDSMEQLGDEEEENGDVDDGEDYDYDEEEEEEDYESYRNGNGKHKEEEEEEDDDGSNSAGDQEYDEDEEEGGEDEGLDGIFAFEDNVIGLIEELIQSNTDKGKKKLQSKNLLRQIVKTLKVGETPNEVLIIERQQFSFRGWRKYIQLQQLRRFLKSGLSVHWRDNPNLQKIFNIDLSFAPKSSISSLQKRMTMSPNSFKSKQRTMDLKRDRQNASNVYSYHHSEEDF
eukprot:gene4541-5657_t